MINFLTLSFLNSSNLNLSQQLSRSAQNTNDLQAINEQVKTKEALVKDLGWDDGLNKSKLMDQMASLLPNDITWREVTFNPVDQATSRVQKSLHFMDSKIRVIGSAQRIIPVNEWLARLKTQKWVKNVQLDSYNYNGELNSGQFIVVIDY